MLRFVVGLGINSVSGALIERALNKSYNPDDFEILPIAESDYELTCLCQIQQRAVQFAKRAKHFFAAEAYFGVASGICIFLDAPKKHAFSAPARIDLVAAIVGGRRLPPQTLNPMDIRSQMVNRVCGLASTKQSVADLVACVRKHCDHKALPPPRT